MIRFCYHGILEGIAEFEDSFPPKKLGFRERWASLVSRTFSSFTTCYIIKLLQNCGKICGTNLTRERYSNEIVIEFLLLEVPKLVQGYLYNSTLISCTLLLIEYKGIIVIILHLLTS